MFYDTTRRDHGMVVDPWTALVVPRPIGWISTIDGQGQVNLAPYSFYNAVSGSPPMVYFSTTGTHGDNPTKHSRRNAEETGEFVVNVVSAELAQEMNVTTTMADYGVDEMKLAGLAPAPTRYVKPPRVARSPIALECKYWKTLEMPIEEGRDASGDGGVRPRRRHPYRRQHHQERPNRHAAFKGLARVGYSEYTTTENVWKMSRPDDSRQG